MSASMTPARERRHGGRVAVAGSVVVHGPTALRGRIADLALGGVRIVVDPRPPLPRIGERLRIELRLDGTAARWLRLLGRVRGNDHAAHAISIQLDHVPAEFEDIVQAQFLAALECGRTLHALLVDERDDRRAALAEALRRDGCHVTSVSTRLDALDALDDAAFHAGLIVIAEDGRSRALGGLRRYLDEVYPDVWRVTLDDADDTELVARIRAEIAGRP